ncbi:MAG: DJ-1/PfpI family protein [Ruminococcaceae bacterium]|nr:DJ-1/PfpI family protein [Oscillospiraceae bacterium]
MVYIILGKGFEEAEAVIPCDLLRRAGVDVRFVGIGTKTVVGGHSIAIEADCLAEQADLTQADMIVLPGGLGGVESILACQKVLDAVVSLNEQGNFVAAICAAPTIFAKLGIVSGKKATCYPGMENEMADAIMCDCDAVRDGNMITGRAAGTAFAFGLELVRALCSNEIADRIATGVVAH